MNVLPYVTARRRLAGAGGPGSGGGGEPAEFVNIGSGSGEGSAEALTLSLPASLVVGNILIAATTIGASRSPVWPAGWTPIGDGFAAYRVVNGTETNPEVTWTGSSSQVGWITQWSSGGGVGATEDNQANSGSPATCPAVTTTSAGSLIAATLVHGTSTIVDTPSGYTSVASDAFVGSGFSASIRVANQTVASSGAQSDPISVTATAVWRTLLVELKAG